MGLTHFQITFNQAEIYKFGVSFRGRRANAHLLTFFNPWTNQRLMTFSLQVGPSTKLLENSKSTPRQFNKTPNIDGRVNAANHQCRMTQYTL